MLAVQPAFSATIQTDLWVYQMGDTVTVTGADYGAGETVEVVTTDPNGVEVDRGAASADEFGAFIYQFVLMSDVPGIYDVIGTGLSSGLSAATQFDPFNVTLTDPAPTTRYRTVAGAIDAGRWQVPVSKRRCWMSDRQQHCGGRLHVQRRCRSVGGLHCHKDLRPGHEPRYGLTGLECHVPI